MAVKKKTKYFVIGSNSFSGSSFINFCLDKGDKVIGISRSKEQKKCFAVYKKNLNIKNFKFYRVDINKEVDRTLLINLVKKYKPDYIINYSAQGMVDQSWQNPEDWYYTNIISQSFIYRNLITIKSIKKIIHVTTPEVYGSLNSITKENWIFNPGTPYAISRASLDFHLRNMCNNFNLPVIFTRTANVYGPGQQLYRIVPKALFSVFFKKKFSLHGLGNSIRSFIYIDDVSRATYLVIKKGKIGETYHISTKNFTTIRNLVSKIAKIFNKKIFDICKISKDRIGKDFAYKLDSSKIRKMGWKPRVNLYMGIKLTYLWFLNNRNFFLNKNTEYIHKR